MSNAYPMKLMISGKSIAELATNARKFLEEIEGTKAVTQSQGSTEQVEDYEDVETSTVADLPTYSQSENTAVGQLDSRGFPWDARIHASSRALTAKGAWRYRRGIEDHEISQIEQELATKSKQIQSAPTYPSPALPEVAPVIASPAVVVPLPVVLPPVSPMGNALPQAASPAPVAPMTPSVPSMVPQPTASVAPPLPAAPEPVTFSHSVETFRSKFLVTLAELVNQGKLTKPYVQQLCQFFQVDEIHKINDQQKDQLFDQFVQHGLLNRIG